MGLCSSVAKNTADGGAKNEGWTGKVFDEREQGAINDDEDDRMDGKSASFSQARDSMIYNKKQLEKAQLHKDHGDQPTEIDLGTKHKKDGASGETEAEEDKGVAQDEASASSGKEEAQ